MDSDVTGCTVLIARVRHVMDRRLGQDTAALAAEIPGTVVALETEGKYDGPAE